MLLTRPFDSSAGFPADGPRIAPSAGVTNPFNHPPSSNREESEVSVYHRRYSGGHAHTVENVLFRRPTVFEAQEIYCRLGASALLKCEHEVMIFT